MKPADIELVELQPSSAGPSKRPSFVVGGSGGGFGGIAEPSKLQKIAARKRTAPVEEESSFRPLVLVSCLICVGALVLLCASLASSWYIPKYNSYDADSNYTLTSSTRRHCVVVDYQDWRQETSMCQDCSGCTGKQRRDWRKSCSFQNNGQPHRCANQAAMYNLVLGLMVVSVGLVLVTAALTAADTFRRLPDWGGRAPVILFFLHLAALAFTTATWATFVAQVTSTMRQDGGAVCNAKEGPCSHFRGCTRIGLNDETLPYRSCWGPGGGFLLAVVASALQLGGLFLLLAGKLQSTVRQVVSEAGRADDLEQLQQLVLQDGVQLTTEAIVEQEAKLRRENFEGSPDAEIEPTTARLFAAALETHYEKAAATETARLVAAEEELTRVRQKGPSPPPVPASAVPLLPLPQSPVPAGRLAVVERVRASSQPPKLAAIEPRGRSRDERDAGRLRERASSTASMPERQGTVPGSLRSALRSSHTISPARVKFSPPSTLPSVMPAVSSSVSGSLGEGMRRPPRSALATAPPTSHEDLQRQQSVADVDDADAANDDTNELFATGAADAMAEEQRGSNV